MQGWLLSAVCHTAGEKVALFSICCVSQDADAYRKHDQLQDNHQLPLDWGTNVDSCETGDDCSCHIARASYAQQREQARDKRHSVFPDQSLHLRFSADVKCVFSIWVCSKHNICPQVPSVLTRGDVLMSLACVGVREMTKFLEMLRQSPLPNLDRPMRNSRCSSSVQGMPFRRSASLPLLSFCCSNRACVKQCWMPS